MKTLFFFAAALQAAVLLAEIPDSQIFFREDLDAIEFDSVAAKLVSRDGDGRPILLKLEYDPRTDLLEFFFEGTGFFTCIMSREGRDYLCDAADALQNGGEPSGSAVPCEISWGKIAVKTDKNAGLSCEKRDDGIVLHIAGENSCDIYFAADAFAEFCLLISEESIADKIDEAIDEAASTESE